MAILALIAIAVGDAMQAGATAARENGRIVFRRYLDVGKSTGAIFTVNPDGTGVSRVTYPRRGVIDTEPDWSADGMRIAFERQVPCRAGGARDGLNNVCALVYTARRDGTGLKSLVPCGFKASTPFPGTCVGANQPAWSADGSKLAFRYNLVDSRYTGSLNIKVGVWVVDADGTNARQVTQRTPGRSWDFGPQWSPDGTSLAFFRLDHRTDTEAVFTVKVDGASEFRVTPRALNAANPNWSPDGRWILFSAESKNGASNIYRVRPDGTRLTNLTRQGAAGHHYLSAAFSPDGTMIVTSRTPGTGPEGAADVVVMDADGSNIRPVTKTRLWDSGVDWGTAPLR